MLNILLCIILLPFAVCAGVFTIGLVSIAIAATVKGIGKAFTRKKEFENFKNFYYNTK